MIATNNRINKTLPIGAPFSWAIPTPSPPTRRRAPMTPTAPTIIPNLQNSLLPEILKLREIS